MILSWIGVIMGIGAILLGNFLEGGHIESLIQATAAMIVAGGTLGATLISSTTQEFKAAMKSLSIVFMGKNPNYDELIKELISTATAARKDGILSLEKKLSDVKEAFFAKWLRYVIDGYDPAVLKEIMEDTIHHEESNHMATAKVWETAGGFSPTIGILGAVLGLIHVMSNLSDSSKLGEGIAVAFVATVYGVGAANLVLLPIGNKLKKHAKAEGMKLTLIYTAIIGIQNGLNPRVIEDRLHNLTGHHGGGGKGNVVEMKKAA